MKTKSMLLCCVASVFYVWGVFMLWALVERGLI